jgi:hypothetical protein
MESSRQNILFKIKLFYKADLKVVHLHCISCTLYLPYVKMRILYRSLAFLLISYVVESFDT